MKNAKVIALHRIHIASPCTASWEAMQGNERVRHCGACNKNVFNLSAMPEADAAALLADNLDGALCVRFYRRADGTVMTSDCGAPLTNTRSSWTTLPAMAGAAALALSAAACNATEAPPAPSMMMGAPPPPAQTAPVEVKLLPAQPVLLMGDVQVPQPPPMLGRIRIEPAPKQNATSHPKDSKPAR
ncbi:hypothetical protein [Massilia sp. CF038]|uniref:hypothetical protein n=1 Tax=Massilia sp. CF038 TaxID=1881045 RepID=UPI00091A5ADF|nr:hypothetical protein [Massilia sp. CF038]SHH08857.1 hypothetical protein SAMN05428948_2712 [Massilia sp. CF038]